MRSPMLRHQAVSTSGPPRRASSRLAAVLVADLDGGLGQRFDAEAALGQMGAGDGRMVQQAGLAVADLGLQVLDAAIRTGSASSPPAPA